MGKWAWQSDSLVSPNQWFFLCCFGHFKHPWRVEVYPTREVRGRGLLSPGLPESWYEDQTHILVCATIPWTAFTLRLILHHLCPVRYQDR